MVGDYVIQNNWMARTKLSSTPVALLHGLVYSLPFLLLTQDWRSLAIIWLTHSLIDRLALAKKWCQLANWQFGTADGFAAATPDYLRVWVVILVDNTFHLAINYTALGWQW
jgi:Protein of unknown function (DUF3307)